MDIVRGYRLESLSRLKCISITEIVLGLINLVLFVIAIALALTHSSTQDTHLTWSWSLFLSVGFYLLLFIAGCYGVHVVRRCRKGVASASSFTALAGMNVILCIIYSVLLVLIIICGVLLGVIAHYMHTFVNQIAVWLKLPKDSVYDSARPSDLQASPHHAAQNVASIVTIVMMVMFGVFGFFLLLFAILTGCAARISRRNAAILNTSSSGNYNDSLLASMGGTYPKQMSTYAGEYQPVKQQL